MKAFISLPRGIVFDTFFTSENLALAASLGGTVFNETGKKLTSEAAAGLIGDCDVYVTAWGSPRLDARILDAAPRLRLLTHLCGTVVPYVSEELWERGVRVISGNRYFAESVAEGTVAYILAALRDIPGFSFRLKEHGEWKSASAYHRGLLGRTVGIVGYGTIARYLVRLLVPFGVKLKVCDIVAVDPAELERFNMVQTTPEDIFSSCDIISLHTAGLPETRHMVGERLLSMIPDGALLVNTARGMLIDESALCAELAKGRFSAVLDVFEKEPPLPESPLYSLPNVMMMPHMAGPTVDRRRLIAHDLLLESAGFIDRGEPLTNEITRAAAERMSAR